MSISFRNREKSKIKCVNLCAYRHHWTWDTNSCHKNPVIGSVTSLIRWELTTVSSSMHVCHSPHGTTVLSWSWEYSGVMQHACTICTEPAPKHLMDITIKVDLSINTTKSTKVDQIGQYPITATVQFPRTAHATCVMAGLCINQDLNAGPENTNRIIQRLWLVTARGEVLKSDESTNSNDFDTLGHCLWRCRRSFVSAVASMCRHLSLNQCQFSVRN